MNGARLQLLASAPRGFGDLLARELRSCGALDVRDRGVAVAFTGDLAVAYRACLESRVASRVFLQIARLEAGDEPAVYRELRALDWSRHVDPGGTLACEFSGRHPAITNTHFGTLRLKDAICDALRETAGSRPSIATERPDVRVHAHAVGSMITVSVDLAGEGLHRRGYRTQSGEAPLRENVAAGILLRSGWDAMSQQGSAFLDPLCGSGTLVIEAAMIAADVAPGMRRDYYGFERWGGHDAALWERLLTDARRRAQEGIERVRRTGLRCFGSDRDATVLRAARDNASRAGVAEIVAFDATELGRIKPPAGHGLLCTNPPYGVRLADRAAAVQVHRELGRVMREQFQGWSAAVLTGVPELGLELGLRAARTHAIWNGAIECRLLRIEIERASERDLTPALRAEPDAAVLASPGAVMFGNRLAKNLKKLSGWARRESVSCYRIYDSDMPEYAFAIDLYTNAEGDERWLYVQEYAAPANIPDADVRRRRREALAAMPGVCAVTRDHIQLRTRRRTPRGSQYRKQDERAEFHAVGEGGLKFWVNFTDYLDTGLFLDHRITRARLRAAARGRRFLNLFSYTGSATVYAAHGCATHTTSVDLSNTYLEWTRRNLELNGFSLSGHELLRADVRPWLKDAARVAAQFDLIFMDPPTFSNSKSMAGVLDTQRDHGGLIIDAMALLARDGLLVFSTNAQRFKLEPGLGERYLIADITATTIPPDFERNARVHQCFEVRHA